MMTYLYAKATQFAAGCGWFSDFSFNSTTDTFWNYSWVQGTIRLVAVVATASFIMRFLRAFANGGSGAAGKLVSAGVGALIGLAFVFNPALLPSVVGAATGAVDVILGWISDMIGGSGNGFCQ